MKDRIAYRMVLDAEEKGILKPGCTIIEPTSGNTGIGLAMVAAVKGYKCIIVMPEKMSNEKVSTLKALGAKIVRTPTEASWESPEGHICTSQKLQKEIPNSVILDQYTNAGNPLAHYDQTAEEIYKQCNGKVDYIVAGAGTGGTITGIGRKFKELSPETKIVAVDPQGSILAHPHHLNDHDIDFYEVEGIGYDFVPTVLDQKAIDMWVKSNDKEAFNAARLLIRHEGLLCGGSSGSALCAALKVAKELPEDKRVVLILPDGIRNYMTKFASDHWMEERGFMVPPEPLEENKWWWNMPISVLPLSKPVVVKEKTTCEQALRLFDETKAQQLLVTDYDSCTRGVVLATSLMSRMISGDAKKLDFIEKIMKKQYPRVTMSTTLGVLSRILEKDPFAVAFGSESDDEAAGILSHKQLLNFLSKESDKIVSNNHMDRMDGC